MPMNGEFDVTIPFPLLKRCESKNRFDPRIDDEYYRNHHLPNCGCGGSGQVPTSLGYALLQFLKWAFLYHAWYLTEMCARPTTMKTVVDFSDEQIKKADKQTDERWKKMQSLGLSYSDE